jgi:hypothetical protein
MREFGVGVVPSGATTVPAIGELARVSVYIPDDALKFEIDPNCFIDVTVEDSIVMLKI